MDLIRIGILADATELVHCDKILLCDLCEETEHLWGNLCNEIVLWMKPKANERHQVTRDSPNHTRFTTSHETHQATRDSPSHTRLTKPNETHQAKDIVQDPPLHLESQLAQDFGARSDVRCRLVLICWQGRNGSSDLIFLSPSYLIFLSRSNLTRFILPDYIWSDLSYLV